ncbi:hypothetical protein ANCDUO_04564 [Ancylostoma duodenale]|uniref:Uncharacterized protein n=1 Tax=Ancylostoma duodenale TaxID=51022 RepID=A0A0C2D691_9BILA|nr:hypothetical protein ANCDUO_04564 [Ancylostoma duodenale]
MVVVAERGEDTLSRSYDQHSKQIFQRTSRKRRSRAAYTSFPMSNCTSIQDTVFEAIDLTAVRALFAVLYSLVWVAAIVGNTLVLYVVSFNQVIPHLLGSLPFGAINQARTSAPRRELAGDRSGVMPFTPDPSLQSGIEASTSCELK